MLAACGRNHDAEVNYGHRAFAGNSSVFCVRGVPTNLIPCISRLLLLPPSLSLYISVCVYICNYICLSIPLSTFLFIPLSTYLPSYLPSHLSTYQPMLLEIARRSLHTDDPSKGYGGMGTGRSGKVLFLWAVGLHGAQGLWSLVQEWKLTKKLTTRIEDLVVGEWPLPQCLSELERPGLNQAHLFSGS